jgi:hypothetical protein
MRDDCAMYGRVPARATRADAGAKGALDGRGEMMKRMIVKSDKVG